MFGEIYGIHEQNLSKNKGQIRDIPLRYFAKNKGQSLGQK